MNNKSERQNLIEKVNKYKYKDTGHTNWVTSRESLKSIEFKPKIKNSNFVREKTIQNYNIEGLPIIKELLKELNININENSSNLANKYNINKKNQKELRNLKKTWELLSNILESKHLKAVMDAHDHLVNSSNVHSNKKQYFDEIDSENFEMEDFGLIHNEYDPKNRQITTAFRVINIRKNEDEPLGITVKEENGQVLIARIMAGSLADRQGMLHVNDIVLEVNGLPIDRPEVLQEIIRKNNSNSIQLKIIPSFNEQVAQLSCHMKALFNYDPNVDSLLPCKELGLPFVQGDILEILNQEDSNWWQARRVNSLNHSNLVNPQLINQHMIINNQQIGLIPSQELEEKRRAFVRPEFDYASKTSICGTRVIKKKKKAIYSSNANTAFDNAELIFYEEVCRLNKFHRKCIVLIGASGVGRRTLKQRLVATEPEKFAGVLPHTSRPIRDGETNGRLYHFIHRDIMEREIEDSLYLEWGELQGHLYGTKLESIRNVIRQGKICVIDCNPQSLKLLKTPEFMPFIVFLGAPPIEQLRFMHDWGRQNNMSRNCTFDRAMGRSSRRTRTMQSLASFYEDEDLSQTIEESNRILRMFEKNFDLCLVNYNFEKTYHQLRESIHQLENEPQWVPISWVLHAE